MQNTAKILEELQLCDDFKTFYDENKTYMVSRTLAEQLCEFADASGRTKAEIIRGSELSEVYGYQIFSGSRLPGRLIFTLQAIFFMWVAGGKINPEILPFTLQIRARTEGELC